VGVRRVASIGFVWLALFVVCGWRGAVASPAQAVCSDGRPAPVVTPGPPLAPISIDSVREIQIRTNFDGLRYDATITHQDGAFSGAAATGEDVASLLKVLQRSPTMQFDISHAGLDRAYMLSRLDEAEGNLHEARSLPAARAAFEASYFDLAAFYRSLGGREFDPCSVITISDYQPELSVVIVTADRHIKIWSRSQKAFLLPLWISDERGERPTFDAALAVAIGRLMPRWVAFRKILLDENAASTWGSTIAGSESVRDAIARAAVSDRRAQVIAASLGLSIDYGISADGAYWKGNVWSPQWPRFRYVVDTTIRSSEAAFTISLSGPQAALQAVRRSRWLASALAESPDAVVELSDGSAWAVGVVRDLYRLDLVTAGDRLAANVLPATVVTVRRGTGDWSRWFLLDDGDMMLYDFNPGTTAFHFGRAWYEREPLVESGGSRISGVIVSADGAIAR
jgi:hypothetical protein